MAAPAELVVEVASLAEPRAARRSGIGSPEAEPGRARAALPFGPVSRTLSTQPRDPRTRFSPLGSLQRGTLGGSPGGAKAGCPEASRL